MESIWHAFQNAASSFADAIFRSLIKDDRYQMLIDGLWMSLKLTIIAAIIGIIIGLLLAIVKLQDAHRPGEGRIRSTLRGWLVGFANGYIAVVRGTPAVVQLLVIYFVVFGRLLSFIPLEDYQMAALAFGINSGAYVAEIIRAGIMAVDKGQTEASRSLGLSQGATMRYVVIPQAIKNVLPALGNEFIVLLKETSIAGYIGLRDLTKGATSIGAVAYDYMVPLLCVAFIYFLMTTTLAAGMNAIERRMRRGD